MKRRNTILLLALVLLTGCAGAQKSPLPISGKVYTRTYQGEGLYVSCYKTTVTNAANSFGIGVDIGNGYAKPVFVNVEPYAVFGGTDPTLRFYDSSGTVIAKGYLPGLGTCPPRGHPETYMYIPGGSVPNNALIWSCCSITTLKYRGIGNDDGVFTITNFNPEIASDDSFSSITNRLTVVTNSNKGEATIVMPSNEEILGMTEKIDITIPVHIAYFIVGDEPKKTFDINVTTTVNIKDIWSQPGVPPLPRARGGHSDGER